MKNQIELFSGNQRARITFRNREEYDSLDICYNQEFIDTKKSFYDDFYENEDSGESALLTTRTLQFEKILEKIKTLSILNSKESIYIDIGAGRGHFVEFIKKKLNVNIIGVEPAIKKETPILKKGTLEDIEIQYDFVSLLDVFEHFKDPEETIKKIYSILKNDGYVCIKVPNKDSLIYQIAKSSVFLKFFSSKILWRLYQIDFPPPHYNYFNKSSLNKMIEKYFNVEECFYVSEVPIRGLFSRFWGIPFLSKLLIIPLAILYRTISIGKLNDGLVIIGKKKSS